jgi:hypothetical protein
MLSIISLLAFESLALATLTPSFPRGEALIEHLVPGKTAEICVIPKRFAGFEYNKSDSKHEASLCAMNVDQTIAACAKSNSSNPGVDFFEPPTGISIGDFTAGDCSAKGGKKEAKYKLSSSCSYTPSILAYYHFSRALGDVGNVPVAVLRTLDLDRHIAIGEKGLRTLERGSLIDQTWRSLLSKFRAGKSGSQADLLFTDNFDQSYGALSKNPKKEEFYKEFFNGGTQRELAFKEKNLIYKALKNPNFQIKREWNTANVQAMLQLRDLSEMILLDTILSQQDRFGNVHFYNKYLYQEKIGDKLEVRSEKDLKDIPSELQAKAVLVKELLLKDNDCGVAKENRVKAAKLLEGVAHLDPKTYINLLKLEKSLELNDTKVLLKSGMLFTENDFRKVAQNIREAAAMLKEKCLKGELKLDLDLDLHFSGEPLQKISCEI